MDLLRPAVEMAKDKPGDLLDNAVRANVQMAVARQSGRIDSQDLRIGRIEGAVDGLSRDVGAMDHRMTVIETTPQR